MKSSEVVSRYLVRPMFLLREVHRPRLDGAGGRRRQSWRRDKPYTTYKKGG